MTGPADSAFQVLVTGAASGIGLAIARVFAGAGHRVHIGDVDGAALRKALTDYPDLTGSLCDVADPASAETLVAESAGPTGSLDVLINNAGIGGPAGPIEDIPVEDWQRTISVNLNGMFHCLRAAVPLMKARRSGCIINISTASVAVALPNRSPYVASKAGVEGLTRELARELGPFGIRANAIAPGLVDNPRGRALVEKAARRRGTSVETVEAEFLNFISLRSWILPEEIGQAALFLASDAGRKISGQILSVSGNVEWEA